MRGAFDMNFVGFFKRELKVPSMPALADSVLSHQTKKPAQQMVGRAGGAERHQRVNEALVCEKATNFRPVGREILLAGNVHVHHLSDIWIMVHLKSVANLMGEKLSQFVVWQAIRVIFCIRGQEILVKFYLEAIGRRLTGFNAWKRHGRSLALSGGVPLTPAHFTIASFKALGDYDRAVDAVHRV